MRSFISFICDKSSTRGWTHVRFTTWRYLAFHVTVDNGRRSDAVVKHRVRPPSASILPHRQFNAQSKKVNSIRRHPLRTFKKSGNFLTPRHAQILTFYRQKLTHASAFAWPPSPISAGHSYGWPLRFESRVGRKTLIKVYVATQRQNETEPGL